MCHENEEKLKHLFLLCPFARAVWFGIDISICTDEFALNDIKDWIQDWLLKPELTQPKGLWFYGQFVCTLWSLWIHRNEVIFKHQNPNPTRVIHHQRVQLRGLLIAFQNFTFSQPSIGTNPHPFIDKNSIYFNHLHRKS